MNSPLFAADKLNKTKSSPTPRILVVDDEQDNLDLLYRTFRKEFAVFRADSGVRALEILSQE